MAEMSKRHLLDIVEKAIDEGFKVELNFYSGGTKEESEDKLKRVIEDTNLPCYFNKHEKGDWFSTWHEDDEDTPIEITVFLGE